MYHVYELIVEEMNTEYLQGRRCTSRTMTNLFFFSSRRRHTRCSRDWSSDVCSSDLYRAKVSLAVEGGRGRSRTVGFHPYYQPGRVFSLVDCHITDFRLMALWRELKRSEEHTSELQSRLHLVCRLLLEKKKKKDMHTNLRHYTHNFTLQYFNRFVS